MFKKIILIIFSTGFAAHDCHSCEMPALMQAILAGQDPASAPYERKLLFAGQVNSRMPKITGYSTPLMMALTQENLPALDWVLENGAIVDADLPLHKLLKGFACDEQPEAALKILLKHGADINAVNDAGEKPLDIIAAEVALLEDAARAGRPSSLEFYNKHKKAQAMLQCAAQVDTEMEE